MDLFKQNIVTLQASPASHSANDNGNLTAMTQDLLILLLPYVLSDDASTLFQLYLTADVLSCKDNGVQKRGYKILAKIVESGKVTMDAEAVLRLLDSLGDGVVSAAKKVILILRIPQGTVFTAH